MSDFLTSVDSVFAPFWNIWKSGSMAIAGYQPDIQWTGSEEETIHERSKFWARASHKVLESKQGAFSGENKKRLTTNGLLSIQIFCPFSATKAATTGRRLAVLVRNAYTGIESNGVWFRNPKIVERPPDKDWFQLIVSIEYVFDEIVP
jgi:hypothetical protein